MDQDRKRKRYLWASVARVGQVTEDKYLQLSVGYLQSLIKKRQSLIDSGYCIHIFSNCIYDQQHIKKYHLVPFDEMGVPVFSAAIK